MSRVCIIGLDGATFRIIDYLIERKRLPNFAAAISSGSRATLKSTIPCLTPAAWTTFYTGTNPGKHGTIDFFKRQAGTYKLTPSNASTVNGIPIWSYAGNMGKRVCVYNVPVSYPAVPVNGIIISGMDAPRYNDNAFYPLEYKNKLMAAIPGFELQPPIDREYLVNHERDPVGECIRKMNSFLAMEMKAIRHLMSIEAWDLFVGIIRAPDTFQHNFWNSAERVMTDDEETTETDIRQAEAVFSCYEKIEAELGEIMSQLGSDCNLLMMSDHGFGGFQREVCVNRILAEAGLLKFVDRPNASAGKRLLGNAKRMLPEAGKRRLKKLIGRDYASQRWSILTDRLVADIDWSKTRIYSLGQFGCMFVNLKGREPMGIVDGEKEKNAVLAEAEAILSTFVDPRDEEPVFTEFYKKDDLYHGTEMENMPDLITVMRDYAYLGIPYTAQELEEEGLLRDPCPKWEMLAFTGTHRREGVLILSGPDISQANLGTREMVDIVPTVAELMGLPADVGWDGAVLGAALRAAGKSHVAAPQPAAAAPTANLEAGEQVYSEEDEEEVRKRLEDLGYL
jgi:predicted AlkP superfamily phosphohydrolase/phosphomutase